MNRDTILQWLLYRCAAISLIAIMFAIVYSILFSDLIDELQSLYIHGNIIVYHTKAIAGAAGIPVYIYGIFAGLRVLFTKEVPPPTTQTSIGTIFTPLCVVITVLGFAIAFLTPIGLAFSPYSNCPQEKLGAYYVTNLELCKTIDPRNWKIEK